jgi:predicted nucleic-acid-binding Zn-ribbon protein
MGITTDTFYVVSCDKCGANSLVHWRKAEQRKDTRAIIRAAGYWCPTFARMIPYHDHAFNTTRCMVEWDVLCMKCHNERKECDVIQLKKA